MRRGRTEKHKMTPITPSFYRRSNGKRAVFLLELFQGLIAAMDRIDIENQDVVYRTSSYTNIRIGPTFPPILDYFDIRRGTFKTVAGPGMFSGVATLFISTRTD